MFHCCRNNLTEYDVQRKKKEKYLTFPCRTMCLTHNVGRWCIEIHITVKFYRLPEIYKSRAPASTSTTTTRQYESLPTILWKHNNIKLSVRGTLSYALLWCPLCGCLKNVPIFLDWHIQDFVIVVECYIIFCVCVCAPVSKCTQQIVYALWLKKNTTYNLGTGVWMLARHPLCTMHSI